MTLRMSSRTGLALLPLLAPGCMPAFWNGIVRSWGPAGEEAGLKISEVSGGREDIGIGRMKAPPRALVVVDGEWWTSAGPGENTSPAAVPASRMAEADSLVLAHVPRWEAFDLAETLGDGELEKTLLESAAHTNIDCDRPFPFRIDGVLSSAVLTGTDAEFSCNHRARATLVGFHKSSWSGGATLLLAAFLHEERPLVGHVLSFTLEPGAILRLPAAAPPMHN